jgi:hypothetical protein
LGPGAFFERLGQRIDLGRGMLKACGGHRSEVENFDEYRLRMTRGEITANEVALL